MCEQLICFDESGNTGPDLHNEIQPIFTLASIRLPDPDARALLEPMLGDRKEVKFSDLRREPAARERLLEFLASGLLTPETARVSIFHKPYTLVAKMVDLLLEPGFYQRGLADEFRRDEGPMKWPTTLYELAPQQLGGGLWSKLQVAFVDAVRRPSVAKTEVFLKLVAIARAREPDARVDFPLRVFAEQAPLELGSKPQLDPLDPAIPALVEQIDFWGQAIGPLAIAHDAASSLERARPYILRLSDPAIEPYEMQGSDRSARFPLQARRIEFVDSKAVAQVQVADLLAGACSFQQGSFARRAPDAEFAAAVAATGVRRLFAQFVAPPEFVRRSMEGA